MTKEEKQFHEIGATIQNAIKGNLFGKPCYTINGKAFCCFFQNEMVFKLNNAIHQEALSLDNSILFDPSGKNRPMKEWVQVSFNYQKLWNKFAIEALKYVSNKPAS